MKTLTLPIKKKWFDMILSGEKLEEYREIKPYYIRILLRAKGIQNMDSFIKAFLSKPDLNIGTIYTHIEFRNGYGKKVPSFIIELKKIAINTGYLRFGAKLNKLYFVLKLGDFVKWINKTPEQQLYENEAADQCNHYDTSHSDNGYEVCNNCGAYLRELL